LEIVPSIAVLIWTPNKAILPQCPLLHGTGVLKDNVGSVFAGP
jgi:hypothetical protein